VQPIALGAKADPDPANWNVRLRLNGEGFVRS